MSAGPFTERRLAAAVEMTGTIKKGVFYVDDKRTLAQRIGQLPDGPAIVRVAPARGARTDADNRRYWATLGQISTQTANTPDELHELYKDKFHVPRNAAGHRTTKLLDEQQFRLYVDLVMGDAAAEWGVEFPLPEVLVGVL